MEILTAFVPGINSIQPVNDAPAPDFSEKVPSGGSEFTSLLNQEINNNGNINISKKQGMGPGPHISPEMESDTKGNSRSCKSDDTAVTGLINPQVIDSMGDEASEEAAGNSENLLNAYHCMAHDSDDGEETAESLDGSGPADENGLKMGALLFKMLNAFLEANNTDLSNNLSEENESPEVMEGPSAVPVNPPAPELPAESGLKMGALLFEMLKSFLEANNTDLSNNLSEENNTCEVTEETSALPENLSTPELPTENGLKIGALLYEILNASQESDNDGPQPDLMAQCNNGVGETRRAQVDGPSENGLKAGMLLSATDTGGKQMDTVVNEDSFMTALTQIANDEGEEAGNTDTFREAPGQAGNKNVNQFKTVLSPEENINPDSDVNKAVSASLTEAAKKSANSEGPQSTQPGPEKGLTVETNSDSSNQVNQQNVSLHSGKAGDGPSSGQAARPAGFTQVLDNVVYVMKGNNRLGVSIDHDTLGKLDINLSMDKGMLNVQINTSERHTREFIENNIQSIMDSLAKEGVTIGGFSVALKERNDHEKNFFARNGDRYQEKEIFPTEEINSVKRGLVNVFA